MHVSRAKATRIGSGGSRGTAGEAVHQGASEQGQVIDGAGSSRAVSIRSASGRKRKRAFTSRRERPASPSASPRTRCGTASPPTCSSGGGPARHPAAAGPHEARNDLDLHSRLHRRAARGGQPAGRAAEHRGGTMARPTLEVADIFRPHGPAWRLDAARPFELGQLKVMSAIERCRTAALGGHVKRCDACEQPRSPTTPAATATAQSARAAPRSAGSRSAHRTAAGASTSTSSSRCRSRSPHIAYQNKARRLRPAVQRRRDAAHHRRRPQAPGRQIGFTRSCTPGAGATHHPHLHCVVPGGGLVARRPALGRLPAGLLPAGARAVAPVSAAVPRKPRCRLTRRAAAVLRSATQRCRRRRVRRWLAPLRSTEWVVYAKPPFGGPEAGARVPGALHAPRGDLQQPAGRLGRARRHLPLEGLPAKGRNRHKTMTLGPTSSCAASCCTSCRAASTASATTACWPTACAKPTSRLPVHCCSRRHPSPLSRPTPHGRRAPTFICRHCGAPMIIIETLPRPHRIPCPAYAARCAMTAIEHRTLIRAPALPPQVARPVALCLGLSKARPLSGSTSRKATSRSAPRRPARRARTSRRQRRRFQAHRTP